MLLLLAIKVSLPKIIVKRFRFSDNGLWEFKDLWKALLFNMTLGDVFSSLSLGIYVINVNQRSLIGTVVKVKNICFESLQQSRISTVFILKFLVSRSRHQLWESFIKINQEFENSLTLTRDADEDSLFKVLCDSAEL